MSNLVQVSELDNASNKSNWKLIEFGYFISLHIQVLKIAVNPDSNTSMFLKPNFILEYTWHLFVSMESHCTRMLSLGINDLGALKRVVWILQISTFKLSN